MTGSCHIDAFFAGGVGVRSVVFEHYHEGTRVLVGSQSTICHVFSFLFLISAAFVSTYCISGFVASV